jgi:hypothetical protein
VAFLALLGVVAVVGAASVMGAAASSNHDVLVTLSLLVVSGVATAWGRRITHASSLAPNPRGRLVALSLLAGAALLTLVAAIELLGNA